MADARGIHGGQGAGASGAVGVRAVGGIVVSYPVKVVTLPQLAPRRSQPAEMLL